MSDTREKRTRQLTIKGQTMFDEQFVKIYRRVLCILKIAIIGLSFIQK
jgi:hypothetical protein